MEKLNKFKIPLILLTVFIIVFSYLQIFQGFFQHDEWLAFGDIFSRKTDISAVLASFFAANKDHYVPIFQIIFYAYLKLFKYNFVIYAFLSILLHLIVTLFVFLLSIRIFRNWKLALISSAFFGLNSSLYQATSWVLYDINSHYSTLFALISLIYFWDFLQKEKRNKLFFSLLFLLLSLLTKEIAVGFFILYPISIILFKGWEFKKQFVYLRTIFISGFIYLSLRISMFFIPGAYEDYSDVFRMQTAFNTIVNIITIPSKIIIQTFFPQEVSLNISRWLTFYLPRFITGIPGTTQFDVFVEQRTLQMISTLVFLAAIFVLYKFWKRRKDAPLTKIVVFSFIFIIINSFIYSFSPGRNDIFSLIDSRSLYLPTIGTAIFLVLTVFLLSKKSIAKTAIFILPLMIWHTFYLNSKIVAISNQGRVRKNILYQIKKDYPNLPQKVIFYTESDTSYYGMPENEKILPFEVGFGKTLMSWYELEEGYPRSFLEKHFLWDLTAQGYKEEGGQGFGYFREIGLVANIVKEENLEAGSIIAYRFNSSDNSLTDITKEVRNKIID